MAVTSLLLMGLQSSFGMQISKFQAKSICFKYNEYIIFTLCLSFSFGLVKSYNMPCTVESASLEPKFGYKFIAGGEDMWLRVFDFYTGEEIGTCCAINSVHWNYKFELTSLLRLFAYVENL